MCACLSVCLCVRSGPVGVNANSSKTVKYTDFKFDIRVPRDSPEMTSKNFSKRGRGQGHVTPLIFSALNANNSKTIKATDFKFGTSVPRDSPDMTPKIFFQKGRGQGHVTP